jgi:hypothetical protein
MSRHLRTIAFVIALALSRTLPAFAGGQVATCISVDGPASDRDALERLVTSEVDRHPSHRAKSEPCDDAAKYPEGYTHLRVELIEVQGDRFLTGRVGGEVPQRVPVEGKDGRALASAVGELLRIVLGNDPVVLHTPGEQSFFGARVLELKNLGRNTIDFAVLETASLVTERATFLPGLRIGFTREVSAWQVGIEVTFAQRVTSHPGTLDLDSLARLELAGTLFFSKDADVAAFGGATLGLAYQRYRGPRAADFGGGDGEYSAVGPSLGLRTGVEIFRSTATRATFFVEGYLPLFVANDQETEIVDTWAPGISLGAAVRF